MAQSKKEKIAKYENFVDTRLKPDLVHAMTARDKVMDRQRVFADLAKNIKMLQENGLKKMRTMVNMGSEVYAQAEVADTSSIYVDVGLGFHVEFKLDEALSFCATKQKLLDKEVEEHTRQIAGIKAQIKLVQEGIRELMNISEERISEIHGG
ncbi:hypothetical protein R1sor_006443 [Riccia sorocarpa]|uniref:Prefoldin alpha subunit n=1 Tax=Riccia sorocarpa TaxID=122646 RepID=A0ABD3HMM8_9MARC